MSHAAEADCNNSIAHRSDAAAVAAAAEIVGQSPVFVAMLDQLNGGPLQLYPAQHHLPGNQIRQTIGDSSARQVGPLKGRTCFIVRTGRTASA